jgi:hypothetical protein
MPIFGILGIPILGIDTDVILPTAEEVVFFTAATEVRPALRKVAHEASGQTTAISKTCVALGMDE